MRGKGAMKTKITRLLPKGSPLVRGSPLARNPPDKTPAQLQKEAQERWGYGPIQIKREDYWAIVNIRIDEEWIELDRVCMFDNFDSTTYPIAIDDILNPPTILRNRRRRRAKK